MNWLPDAPEVESHALLRLDAVLAAVIVLLRYEGRLTYRALKQIFAIDDIFLAAVRDELAFKQLARDEAGRGLVWTAATPPPETPSPTAEDAALRDPSEEPPALTLEPPRRTPEAERRQLTVMFCDLVGSTDLSGRLDPEDLREVVRAYQETAAEVIGRYEGHIAQYLGDGLLVYFGWPTAHEDDAQRSVHAGLDIVAAMLALNTRLQVAYDVQLAVRLGVHTGPVVVGEMGGGGRYENLALGETPNIAARLEGLALSNGIMISHDTNRLLDNRFVLETMGPQELKGVSHPMEVWRVLGVRDSNREDDVLISDAIASQLVGRDEDISLLLRLWEQGKEGRGQVVLITGDGGIGKTTLVNVLRRHVRGEGCSQVVFQGSQMHQQSMFHPRPLHRLMW